MKYILFIILSILWSVEPRINVPRNLKEEDPPTPPGPSPGPGPGPGGDDNTYDYSNYKANSINEDLDNQELISNTQDQSVAYINKTGINFKDTTLIKESGDSSNIENSEFYGVNAALLVQGGEVTIKGGKVQTKAKGANAICVTNKGKVTISGTKIVSTSESSGRGLHATYGGQIDATNVEISSVGASCANLATDRGEGVVSCTECNLSTAGAGSPLIYSTGTITVEQTTGTSTGAQMVVVEGKNTATVTDSELKCNGTGNRKEIDKCGVMIYQSMSGDAADGTGTYNCKNSKMEILEDSSVYKTAPMFFVTNTKAVINLDNCSLKYGSEIFLDIKGTTEWGTSGSNGGEVTLNLNNQEVFGDIQVDGISSLSIIMINSSIKGKINTGKTAYKLSINLDAKSKITLTGNSYYTSLTNAESSGSNIIKGGYVFEQYGGGDGDTSSHGSLIKFSLLIILLILL